MAYTEKEIEALKKELTDPRRIFMQCDEHDYIGDTHGMPTSGCKMCWFAYYFTMLAQTPPHLRNQRLEELQAVVRSLAYDIDKGKVDFQLYNHPIVKRTKE